MDKYIYPTDSVTIDLGDGVEREIRYSMGSMRRLKKLFGAAELSGILSGLNEDRFPELLYEGLVDKSSIASAEDLADKIQLGAVPYLANRVGAAFAATQPANQDPNAQGSQTAN